MRLLVAPHDLGIGGSQINAIDLAAEAAKAGHHVVVYGKTGALVDYIESRGLEFIPARNLRYRPAPSRIAQLAKLARSRRLDLIHAYEWPPCLDAYFGAHRIGGVPLLCTVMSMAVSPFVPSSIPLMLGTEALAAEAARRHRAPVWVLEPSIDTVADSPSIEGSQVRHALGIADDSLLMVTASGLRTGAQAGCAGRRNRRNQRCGRRVPGGAPDRRRSASQRGTSGPGRLRESALGPRRDQIQRGARRSSCSLCCRGHRPRDGQLVLFGQWRSQSQ